MNGKTHAGIGAVAYVAVCNNLPCKFNYTGIAVIMIASLLPDIDHPNGFINKKILHIKNKTTKTFLYLCLGIIVLYYNLVYRKSVQLQALGFSLIIVAFSTHRNGFTHSLTGLITFSTISGYIGSSYKNYSIIYLFMLGYGTHLLCDMLTSRGISLFYPFKKKNVKFPLTYSMNSNLGKIIEDSIIILGFIYVLYKLPKLNF